ncbi:hypothetical protein AKJ47_02025 [candidate division MSBL1 archaeon SCGC-AAA261G05]|uniref:Uncharacterized protein n=3 Tax=candidate division MSBL1 TaxID=215777 RepID=A0A133UZK4_9EURY|nr:hypothetical protein AKJ42_02920 [candidate division MSBL1 archaeon SCGC-AAA261C02]KXB03542.1 hypothetical protein AKJ47_02025 [candidate division MSBL1 archaeon SCGC-AAA261G05]KXB04718.1 hypothetical protein AKJ48_01670 [candidate division MSBL1 archaeon SCGC-AAA261O19]
MVINRQNKETKPVLYTRTLKLNCAYRFIRVKCVKDIAVTLKPDLITQVIYPYSMIVVEYQNVAESHDFL